MSIGGAMKPKTVKSRKQKQKTAFFVIAGLALAAALFIAVFNAAVIWSAAPYIRDIGEIDDIEPADCALVPGALVYGDGRLSWVLQDRVDYAIALYDAGKVKKLLLTGDHGQKDYDEVNAMKDYAVAQGVPQDDIFLDHAGFSTYESMYRARDVFRASRVIIVTQAFHLARAVYDARQLGLDAEGVASNPRRYGNETKDALRESLARVKDFFCVNLFHPLPKYLGEAIPISGSGAATHDKG
jgi:vancomycin permeability regulator SanA